MKKRVLIKSISIATLLLPSFPALADFQNRFKNAGISDNWLRSSSENVGATVGETPPEIPTGPAVPVGDSLSILTLSFLGYTLYLSRKEIKTKKQL